MRVNRHLEYQAQSVLDVKNNRAKFNSPLDNHNVVVPPRSFLHKLVPRVIDCLAQIRYMSDFVHECGAHVRVVHSYDVKLYSKNARQNGTRE